MPHVPLGEFCQERFPYMVSKHPYCPSSVTCCPSSPVCTNSVADCLYQGARFLEWEKVMHLLPAYEAGGEEDGSLVVKGGE